jgi:hypothetical protein
MDVRDYIAAGAADFARALRYVGLSRLPLGAESIACLGEELAAVSPAR